MSDAYTFDIRTDEGAEALAKLAKAFGLTEQAMQDSGQAADTTEEKLDGLGQTTSKTSGMMERLGKIGLASLGFDAVVSGATKLLGVFTGLGSKTLESSAAGDEQRAINDQLSASLIAATGNVDIAEKAYADLQARIAEGTAATDFGDEDIAKGLTRFIDLTGQASVSQKELSTLLGIAARRGEDVTASSEKLARARKGDVEAMKELTPLNKEQVATLTAIRDPAERGAAAMAILSATYEGAANTSGTASGAIKEQKDAMGDAVQTVGMLINQSGALQAILGPITKLFREQEGALKDNAGAVQELALSIASKLVTAARFGVEVLSTVAQGAVYVGAGFDTAKFGMEVFLRGLVITGAGISSFVTDVLAKAIDKLGEFGADAADLADAVGADGLAAKLREGSQGLAGFSDTLDNMSSATLAVVDSQMSAIGDSAKGLKQDLAESQQNLKAVQDVADKVDGVLGEMAANLEYAKHSVKDTVVDFNKAAKPVSAIKEDTKETLAAQKDSNKETAEQLGKRRALRAIDKLIMQAQAEGNEEHVIGLEFQKKLIEADLERLKNGKDKLAVEKQANAVLRAQYEREREVADLERSRMEDARKAHQERLEHIQEARDREREAEEERIDNVRQMGGLFANALAGYQDAAGAALGATAQIGEAIFELTARYDELRLAGESAGNALAGSAAGLSGVLGATAAQYIKDTKKQAAVRGAFAAAEAALLYATGNIPGGIAATGASIAHFAVAGGAGGGGVGGSTSNSTSSARTEVSRSAGVSTQAADEQARRTGRYIAEAINGDRGQAGGINISFDLSGSTNLESSPTVARRLTQTFRKELEREGIRLNRRGI